MPRGAKLSFVTKNLIDLLYFREMLRTDVPHPTWKFVGIASETYLKLTLFVLSLSLQFKVIFLMLVTFSGVSTTVCDVFNSVV